MEIDNLKSDTPTLDLTGPGEPAEWVFYWWCFISVVSVLNILAFVKIVYSKSDASCKSTKEYDTMMKWLALPYVI